MIRGKRLERLEQVCKEELELLDKRTNNGEPLEAISNLKFGKSKL